MLHIVANPEGLASCENALQAKDSVVFAGDAAYSAKTTDCAATFVIDLDRKGRGLETPEGVTCISYDEFVDLIVATERSITWA